MAIRLRSHCRKTLPNPSIHRFFSTTSSNGEEDDKTSPTTSSSPAPASAPSSSFSSIRASLRQPSPPPYRSRNPDYPPPHPPPRSSNASSFEEIRKSLLLFRNRYAERTSPEGHDASSQPSVSFQDVYNRNVIGQGNADVSSDAKELSFDSIRERLRKHRESSPAAGRDRRAQGDNRPSSLSLSALKESLKLKASEDSARSADSLRISLFGRETAAAKTEAESQTGRTDFLKTYDVKELGRKLRELRPPEAATKKKDWFSLEELNERLKKLREIEDKEPRSGFYPDIRDSLLKLKNAQEVNSRQRSMQKLALLGQFGGQISPSFMVSVPKEHLVEKYFHPDNMSSAEKLKLELKRVREEFKMSESDCGSSRVQVALLTTKIKHLSSVLHKKDKHSRKGLQAMVQKRKKLLKYLRRTDWESYCLVLSKLGLRDNPDFKNLKI